MPIVAKALYIHWPFCAKKCPYCDFNSHVRASVDHAAWLDALGADMRYEAQHGGGERLSSIFFGGGTPSLMPPRLVAALLETAEASWGFEPDIEITLEANPSSVEAANFGELAKAGINRVSLGVQSFDDEALKFLGRLHSASEAEAALEIAQDRFERVSFDLIYALPGQTVEGWRQQLSYALGKGTGHLSLYQLTIEPGTRFASMVRRREFQPLDDDEAADLFDMTQELTGSAGLPAYEISNHAREGDESRHNLTYWRYEDYCGIGPGAHGRRGAIATTRHKKPENWLAAIAREGHGAVTETHLNATERAAEALLMGLRLREGIDLVGLTGRFGLLVPQMIDESAQAELVSLGLLWEADGRIGVTPRGLPLLDAILPRLVSDDLVAA